MFESVIFSTISLIKLSILEEKFVYVFQNSVSLLLLAEIEVLLWSVHICVMSLKQSLKV